MHPTRLFVPVVLVASTCTSLIVLFQLEMICGNEKLLYCTSGRILMSSRISLSSSDSLRQKYPYLHDLLDSIGNSVETARLQAMGRIINDNVTQTNYFIEEIRTVNAMIDENYFSKVRNMSHVTLLQFRATADELTRAVTWTNFMAVANNCSLTPTLNTGNISAPHPECQENLESLLPTRSFSPTVLAHAMPAGKLVVDDDRYVLTYLHIIHDAVVSSEGDVYSHNVRMVPWRCERKIPPANDSTDQRMRPRVYNEVRPVLWNIAPTGWYLTNVG